MNTSVIALGARKNMARVGVRSTTSIGVVLPFFIAILLTLFAIVYFKDLNRRMFLASQSLDRVMQVSNVQQGKLLLEQSTLTAQSRIQSIAQNKLGMVLPSAHNVVMLSLPSDNAMLATKR